MQTIHQTIKTLLALAVMALLTANTFAQKDSSRLQKTIADTLPKVKELAGVVVTASKPVIVMKTDRISMNVAQSPLAAGENIYEAIKRMPGITEQGGLQFRNKNVAVYINDRPTAVSGDDLATYLSAMPANTVERVDIITNPPARYDAAGRIIINIVLAKNKNFGTSGTVNAGTGAGRYGRYNGGFSLSYRQKNINLYGSADAARTQTYGDVHTQRFITAGNMITEDQHTITNSNSYSFKLGLDYDLSKRSSMGFLIKGIGSRRTKDIDNSSLLHYYSGTDDSMSTVATDNRSSVIAPSVNLYYKAAVGKKNGQLSINADWYRYNKKWNDDFITRYYDAAGKEYQSPYWLRDNSPAGNVIRSLSADYSFSAGNVNYEMGVKSVFTTTDNNVNWESYNGSQWINDAGKSNHFIYHENINAAYLSLARTIKKFSLQLGLRAEQTNTEGNSVTLDRKDKNSYLSLFPSVDVSYNASEKQQFSMAYRRKIERFGFDIVNPFVVYQSQYAYYQGNPDIKPTFSDNFELGWTFNNQWMAAASWGYYTSVISNIYRKSPNGEAIVSTFDNVASANQLDLNLSYTKSFFNKKLITTSSIMALYAKYNAPAGSQLGHAGFGAGLMSNNVWMMGKGWKAELNMSGFSAFKFGSMDIKARFTMGGGIAKSICKNTGTLTLSVTDILNTNKQRFTASSYGVASVTRDNSETRFIKLSFSWRFGNKNVKAARMRKTGIEDVQSRMGN